MKQDKQRTLEAPAEVLLAFNTIQDLTRHELYTGTIQICLDAIANHFKASVESKPSVSIYPAIALQPSSEAQKFSHKPQPSVRAK